MIAKTASAEEHIKLDGLRSLAAVKNQYEETFGWPVVMAISLGHVLVATGTVLDVVFMPMRFGSLVLAELRGGLLAGPVIGEPAGWWAFLTLPATTRTPSIPSPLQDMGVRAVSPGDYVVLPAAVDSDGQNQPPYWIERPRSQNQLPPWTAVIGAGRRVAQRDIAASALSARS